MDIGSTLKLLPQNRSEWLVEIADAYKDARDTLPFMPLVGVFPSDTQLFQLAPHVMVKFRGLPRSQSDAAVEAALCSYVASKENAGATLDDPYLAFAFCYLASHFGMNLVRQETIEDVMAFLEEQEVGPSDSVVEKHPCGR